MRSGTARWLGKPDKYDLKDGTALLEITTSRGVSSKYWVYHGKRGTRLMKQGKHTIYGCDLALGWCECPDHQKRGVTCKHVKALRAALPKVNG